MQPIFLKAVLQDKIWGGSKLYTHFGLDLPSQTIGEAWSISAHPNGVSEVISPAEFAGMGLDELYQSHPELFGGVTEERFPLLTKILDANQNLSVQVHPDDKYGLEHEGELGKTECWYIISADPGSKIIYGHNAQTPEEFSAMVEEGRWDDLLREVPVKDGDFFYVPHGTIHAIGAGIVILETQQNSDTTYRVYDYGRTDAQGNERDLHIQQSLDVTQFPHQDPQVNITEDSQDGGKVIHYLTNEYFSVYKWDLKKSLTVDLPKEYYLATVITGEGEMEIDGKVYPLHLADSFILPSDIQSVTLRGDLEIIVSNPETVASKKELV